MSRAFYLAVALVAIDILMSAAFWHLEGNPIAHAAGYGPFLWFKVVFLVGYIGLYSRLTPSVPRTAQGSAYAVALLYGAAVASNAWVLLT